MWLINRNKVYKSEINGKITIGKREGKVALFAGGVTQSGGELVEMWNTVSKKLKKEYPGAKNCLILGFGGGTFAASITKEFKNLKITGIEIDPVMIDVYQENLSNKKINIKLINSDVFKWLKSNNKRFDIILVDLYIGRHNPEQSRKKGFFRDISSHLSKNGVVIYNAHFNKKKLNEFNAFRNLIDIFFFSEIIYEFPLNKMLYLTQRVNISKSLKIKL